MLFSSEFVLWKNLRRQIYSFVQIAWLKLPVGLQKIEARDLRKLGVPHLYEKDWKLEQKLKTTKEV